MKKIFILFLIVFSSYAHAGVNYGTSISYWIIPTQYGCDESQLFLTVGFSTYGEVNNDYFEIRKSTDTDFESGYTVVGGYIDGCGTCADRNYQVIDYGPFNSGTTYYYQVRATDNWGITGGPRYLGQYTDLSPTIINWTNQVSSTIVTGSSPNTESSYSWGVESKSGQGITISLSPTEKAEIYAELSNHKINFALTYGLMLANIEVSIDNASYINIYTGTPKSSHVWDNSSSYFTSLGSHSLKVNFMDPTDGIVYHREYTVNVVPQSQGLYKDNFCNTLRVWKSNAGANATPLILSEGFDAYNTRSEQFYIQGGNDLVNCLLSKGFDIYIINFKYNSQSIRNNAAVFSSAIRYVSAINGNKPIIAAGMSMGGIINRYACSKAEAVGSPLPISKFLSLDAPHQGARISSTLQNWRKDLTTDDGYAEHAANNDAAKELLLYNAYDVSGTIHSTFFTELNSLNSDGYPHLVPTIGVSFSNTSPNPSAAGTEFLFVEVAGAITSDSNEHFYLSTEEAQAGSYMPRLVFDPIPVTLNTSPPACVDMRNVFAVNFKDIKSSLLSILRPFSDPTVTIYQMAVPAFIPHNSSLDIVGGISKFNIAIQPSVTSFHDEIPSDVIQPLITALINQDLNLQDKTITDTRNYIAGNKIETGYSVTTTIPNGNFILSIGSVVSMRAGNQIVLKDGFIASTGSNFNAKTGQIECDGLESQQYRSNSNSENDPTEEYSYEQYTTEENVLNKALDKNGEAAELISIFPNPSNDYFTIETTVIPSEIIVYNIQGIEVLNLINIESNITKIDLSSYSPGIYFLKIEKGNREYLTKKLIKQK